MTPRHCVLEAPQSFPKTMAALAYAERLHAGQRRQADGAPFVLHPLEVCCLLHHTGAPDHVIAVGVLHDTIEKTDANAAGLRTRFGLTIATLEALMVFAADKISKARELSLEREQTRQSRLPLVTQLRTDSRTLPASVNGPAALPGASSRQGEIRWDLVTEGIGFSSTTTASRVATSDTTHITIPGWS